MAEGKWVLINGKWQINKQAKSIDIAPGNMRLID